MRVHRIHALIAVASLALAGCGGDSDDGGGSGGTVAKGTVVMQDIAFSPKELTVKVGETVTWRNRESIEHNVVADSVPGLKSELLGEDDTFEYVPKEAGTIAYVCTVHPGMEGTLTVEQD